MPGWLTCPRAPGLRWSLRRGTACSWESLAGLLQDDRELAGSAVAWSVQHGSFTQAVALDDIAEGFYRDAPGPRLQPTFHHLVAVAAAYAHLGEADLAVGALKAAFDQAPTTGDRQDVAAAALLAAVPSQEYGLGKFGAGPIRADDEIVQFVVDQAGLGFVLAVAGLALLGWAGPPFAKALTEWLFDSATGHSSNFEAPFADLYAPDIYVANHTGGPQGLRLQLPATGAFDVVPGWTSGTWDVTVEPDGSLDVDGARLSHLHYQLGTVAGWQRQTGWRISRRDFAAWAREVLPAYGFSPAATEGFVQAWSGLQQGTGDLDVYPQPRAVVDRLEPLRVQPPSASSRRVWFLFSPADGDVVPQPVHPEAAAAAGIDVQEWGVVFDPGAHLAEAPR